MKLSPVEYVIKVFGGVRATARAIGYVPSAVSKWRWQGGGNIPTVAQELIYDIAQDRGLDITPHDLIKGREVSFGQEVNIEEAI